MRILLFLLLIIITGCNQHPGSKNTVPAKIDADSLKASLTGLWKGMGKNGLIWNIRTDSVCFYQFKAAYSYIIQGRNFIIDLPGGKDTLRNITVIKDTMFFSDEGGSLTKAFRINDSVIRYVPIAGVVNDSMVKEDLKILEHDFKILSASKFGDSSTGPAKDVNACKRWTLSKKDILHIFRSSELIGGTEWDLAYAVMPCSYKGEFLMDGKKGNYEVNAGSYVTLVFKDTTIFLGCKSKRNYKYFLEHPNY
jgi:hypothetical protein